MCTQVVVFCALARLYPANPARRSAPAASRQKLIRAKRKGHGLCRQKLENRPPYAIPRPPTPCRAEVRRRRITPQPGKHGPKSHKEIESWLIRFIPINSVFFLFAERPGKVTFPLSLSPFQRPRAAINHPFAKFFPAFSGSKTSNLLGKHGFPRKYMNLKSLSNIKKWHSEPLWSLPRAALVASKPCARTEGLGRWLIIIKQSF